MAAMKGDFCERLLSNMKMSRDMFSLKDNNKKYKNILDGM